MEEDGILIAFIRTLPFSIFMVGLALFIHKTIGFKELFSVWWEPRDKNPERP